MKQKENSYHRAKTHVNRIKGFYSHLFIYIVFLILWLVFAKRIFGFVVLKTENTDKGFLDWVDINLWINPLIWGLVVVIHGLYAYHYKSSLLKKWEDNKIKEYMAEGDENASKNQWE